MSINFNPGPKIQNLLDQGIWWTIANYTQLTQSVTGTGSTGRSFPNLAVFTGTTAASTSLAQSVGQTKLSRGKSQVVIDWSKKVELVFTLVLDTATTNGIARFTLGKSTSDGVGALANKGLGIQIENLALKGLAHNGSSLATVDFSLAMTTPIVYQVKIVSDGAGNVEWFVDGVSKGSTAGGPSSEGTGGDSAFQLEADNGADSAAVTVRLGPLSIYVEQ